MRAEAGLEPGAFGLAQGGMQSQAFVPSSTAFSGMLAGRRIKSRAAHRRSPGADIASAFCATVLPYHFML